MTEESADVFLDELSAWAEKSTQDLEGSSDDAALLFDLAHDYLGCADLSELTPLVLRRLLLDVFPRKITVWEPEDAEAVIPTMREVFRFLRDTGRIPHAAYPRLVHELDEIEPQFADAVMDPSKWGIARTFAQAMIADDIDAEDPDAVQGWIGEYNERPDAERNLLPRDGQQWSLPLGLSGEAGSLFDEEPDGEDGAADLSPVRLPPSAELAAAARACPLLASAQRLAEWLGPSRPLTGTGVLRLADARAVITELGLADAGCEAGEARFTLDSLRSARDFVPLDRLWIVAQVAGLVDVEGRRARPGPHLGALAGQGGGDGGADGGGRTGGAADAPLLMAWSAAFLALVHPDFPAPGGPLSGVLQDELIGMLTLLYAADGPVELSDVADAAASQFPGGLRWATDLPGGEHLVQDAVTGLLAGPAEAGAVALTSAHAALTPLGLWGMHMILRAQGVPVHAIGDYAESGAAEMLSAIARYNQADHEAELAGWVERRSKEDAAAELAAVIAAGTPIQRMAGLDALGSLGPAGRDAAGRLVGEPGVGALTAMWLASVGENPEIELSHDEALWVLVEISAAALDTLPPLEAVKHLTEDADPADLAEQMAQLWCVDHPRTLDVLKAVADHYPDRVVAKAARKAIFRTRGRSAGPAAPPAPARGGERPDRSVGQRKSSKRKRRR